MHKYFLNIYHFINKFNKNDIINLDKNVSLIFRNYSKKNHQKTIIKIKNLCKKHNRKIYISNDLKLGLKLNLDGIYIPSFNKKKNMCFLSKRTNFEVIGSAHNIPEIKTKEKQGVNLIFLSPLFKTKKNNKFLDIVKFKNLSKNTNKKIIALGGLNVKNIKKIKNLNIYGYASISYIKNNSKIFC